MQFKVQQYERCQTMAEGSIEDHLIGITKPTIDRLLKMDNPADCIALYTFYAYTRKWQKNSAVYATSDFAMKGLDWGRDRFSKAKAQLKESGFVEDVQRKDESGKVVGWYVGVRFAQNATLANFDVKQIENHPTDFPQGGSSTVWKNRTQIPITNTKIPITNNKIQTTNIKEEDLFSSIRIEENKPKKKKLAAIQKPDGVSEQVWDDFIALRKAKRAPLTETAMNSIQREVKISGWTLEDALTECVSRGWQGFKASWVANQSNQQDEYPQRAC
jgi:hypothetical protein